MDDTQVRDRVVAKRDAIARKIDELQKSLQNQKTLLSEMNSLLSEIDGGAGDAVGAEEASIVAPRRRGRPKTVARATKQPRLRSPFRRLSVAKAVRQAIEELDGEFGIGDLVQAIYETDEDTDLKRVKFAVTNEISDLSRRNAGVERVSRGVYRRTNGGAMHSSVSESAD